MTQNVISQQGDTVDLICQRHLGTTASTEAVLLANPGLARKGITLPAGIPITLPTTPQATPKKTKKLWD